ncbi:HAD domain-containing protein [Amnibacterium endophyticum]|uniref:HAD domain-containing protein n=1 Tax=Amnibacterium endophyticum TaxID=2109337 RepID=A0ABW4LEX8_9MICO
MSASTGAVVLLDVDGVVNPLWRPGAAATRMRIDAAVGARVRRLAGLAEVVWATTWDAGTRATITATFGLPAFRAATAQDPFVRPLSPNLPAVSAWLTVHEPPGGWRAVAWIDDELEGDARAWAREQPFLVQLVRPDPVQGLQDAHVDLVEQFLAAGA